MQASSKFAKAIHICIYLNYSEKELVASNELAESIKTNPVVIRRLVGLLKKKGIVGSTTGAHGGFFLQQSAEFTHLWDIYLAVREEDFFHRPKVNPDCVISSNLKILVHDSFSAAELSMKEELQKTNIQQLTQKLRNLLNTESEKKPGKNSKEEVKIF